MATVRPVQVVHVTRDYPPAANGGLSTAVGGMVRASVRSGVDCAVISLDGWRPRARPGGGGSVRETQGDGVRILRVTGTGAADLREAADWLTEGGRAPQGPYVVHIHDGMLWELAAGLRQEIGAPVVASVHVLHAVVHRLRGMTGPTLSLAGEERTLKAADLVLVPSPAVLAHLEASPELRDRVRCVPLGVDPEPARVEPARADSEPVVLYVGRFADVKGTDVLWETIPRIAAAHPSVRFVIAGGIPENRRAERRWRRRFDDRAPPGVRERTRFTGWLEPRALAAVYAGADLLLAPSRFETFGQAVLEAMHRGVAVVTTRCGGVESFARDGDTGALVEPGDPGALVERALTLLNDPAERARLAAAGAGEASRWTWAARIDALLAAYGELL